MKDFDLNQVYAQPKDKVNIPRLLLGKAGVGFASSVIIGLVLHGGTGRLIVRGICHGVLLITGRGDTLEPKFESKVKDIFAKAETVAKEAAHKAEVKVKKHKEEKAKEDAEVAAAPDEDEGDEEAPAKKPKGLMAKVEQAKEKAEKAVVAKAVAPVKEAAHKVGEKVEQEVKEVKQTANKVADRLGNLGGGKGMPLGMGVAPDTDGSVGEDGNGFHSPKPPQLGQAGQPFKPVNRPMTFADKFKQAMTPQPPPPSPKFGLSNTQKAIKRRNAMRFDAGMQVISEQNASNLGAAAAQGAANDAAFSAAARAGMRGGR